MSAGGGRQLELEVQAQRHLEGGKRFLLALRKQAQPPLSTLGAPKQLGAPAAACEGGEAGDLLSGDFL